MRNTILVTMDSLRADHTSFAGHDRETSPTLDGMAADGLTYTNAISPGPSTPESMPVILTGTYPTRSAQTDAGNSKLATRQATIGRHMQSRRTLAERFSDAGYATAAFSPNPYTCRYFGFDEGFDRFEDFLGGSRERLYRGMVDGMMVGLPKESVLPVRVLLNWAQREEVFKPWESFYDAVIEWTASVEEPYFLWILLMDTHDPYLTPSRFRTQSRWAMYQANWRLWRQGHKPPFDETTHERLVRAYDDSIRYADEFLARLQSDIGDDDPLIAVHGDHGEAFGEHGTYGHHARLYEENVHVPFVIEGGPSETVDTPISLQSIPDLLQSLAIDGRRPDVPRSPAIARTLDEDRLTARGRRWKYIRTGTDGTVYYLDGPVETEPIGDEILEDRSQGVVAPWLADERERARIDTAIAELRGSL